MEFNYSRKKWWILSGWIKNRIVERYYHKLLEVSYRECYINNSEAKVFESGEYHNDVRIGQWNYIYNDNNM